MAILSSFLCVTVRSSLIPCSLVRSLILPPPPSPVPLALYHSLSPSVIPPQSPPPDRGDGRACGRVSCTGAHTARPPAGPQCTANSHKAPTDTQMDKRIWTYTCKSYVQARVDHGSARTLIPCQTPHAPLHPSGVTSGRVFPCSFAPPLWTLPCVITILLYI